MIKQFILVLTAIFFAVTSTPGSAHAKTVTVEEILQKVDENLIKVKDQTYDALLEVVRGNKTIKTIKFIAQLKGLHMKLVKFTAPGDVRGMSILTTADGLMYVYMPSYKRVRRVASHVRNQGFMGTDISPEELGTASLSVGWSGVIKSDEAEHWVLEMIPKKNNKTMYTKLHVTVAKNHGQVVKIDSFGDRDKIIKSQVRSKWTDFGDGITIPSVFTYKDHRTGSKTIMRFFGCKVNQAIPDSAFTKRALMRSK